MQKPALIWEGDSEIIPLPDVQHAERTPYGLRIITRHTTYNFERDTWENAAFISNHKGEDAKFLEAWRAFHEWLATPPVITRKLSDIVSDDHVATLDSQPSG